MNRALVLLILAAGTTCAAARAEDAPPPPLTKHQMMKECMAKQVASEGGMPKEEMKKSCKDVTQTERDNEKTEKNGASGAKSGGTPQP